MRTYRTNHDQVSWRWRAIIGKEDNTITARVVHAKKDLVTLAAVQSVAYDRENREAKQLLALTLPVGPLLISWCWLLHRKSSTTVSSAWLAQNTAISICVDIIPVFKGYKQAYINDNYYVGWTLDESSSHKGWHDKWKLRRLYLGFKR